MSRSSLAALVLAFSACSTPAQQAAPVAHKTVIPRSETMTPPAMPFACDLAAAPVGSWADYEERTSLTATTRIALVGKGAVGTTVELTSTHSLDVVTAYVFPPGNGPPSQITKRVMVQRLGVADLSHQAGRGTEADAVPAGSIHL
jgi:hypothetical protein